MAKVLLGDVAKERRETYKGSKAGYPIVGLEHIRDFAECYAGATPSTKIADYWDNGTIPSASTSMFSISRKSLPMPV